MTYEKPQIRDFGNIAKHTYTVIDGHDFGGGSGQVCDGADES